MKSLDPADKVSSGGEANSKKLSGLGRTSLVAACKKISKICMCFNFSCICNHLCLSPMHRVMVMFSFLMMNF